MVIGYVRYSLKVFRDLPHDNVHMIVNALDIYTTYCLGNSLRNIFQVGEKSEVKLRIAKSLCIDKSFDYMVFLFAGDS